MNPRCIKHNSQFGDKSFTQLQLRVIVILGSIIKNMNIMVPALKGKPVNIKFNFFIRFIVDSLFIISYRDR